MLLFGSRRERDKKAICKRQATDSASRGQTSLLELGEARQPSTMAILGKAALQRATQAQRANWIRKTVSSTCAAPLAHRGFHTSSPQQTDGVFRELTSMRVRTPWVEALQRQKADNKPPGEPSGQSEVPKDRDLSPKRMSESYHSVILPLARDPWLLDTYLNASGHIRLGTIFMDLDALSGVIA
jgi:acyl-coenzyme A thioesterase 9